MSSFPIGRLAEHAGVGIDTVRYYERAGLLAPAGRSPSGYRQYGEGELRRLRFIRRAQHLGFSLAEIGDLLAIGGQDDIAAVRELARRHLDGIEQRMAELQRMRDALGRLVTACPGHGLAQDCPILRAFDEGDVA
ncbi:MerR family DNA-binding protein [Dokdonella sp.]|uniref:MerR family DNA-binding protein n=1 Tax=Dokdonella sp. TaxID=2291710 RepID=UPI0025BCF2AB|nr:MerR family DNA-binding protein [Dokdonella sp.]MBX3693517.1 MerR family DNA-binding protein [Dokdonella sp.]MCW5568268.1 MerR family DNA-binding protein [Dokdonella sp.]